MMAVESDRRGMTLVELLMVIAILGLLAITVLPQFGATLEARRSRAGSTGASSTFSKAQARSVGRLTWSGFHVVASNTGSWGADKIVLVDCPEPYRGDTTTAAVNVSCGTSGTATPVAADDFTQLSSRALATTSNDLIRFDGRDPAYRVTSGNSLPIEFVLRDAVGAFENLGHSTAVTPWPSSAGPHTIEILRQPIPAGAPFVMPEGRVIDLRWSGQGSANSTAAGFATFPIGATVSVLFDNAGRLRRVGVAGQPAMTAVHPVFFLVGRADRAGQNPAPPDPDDDGVGANWQYPDSWWIVIDPMSGIVKSAQCAPTNLLPAATFVDSQQFIREDLTGRPWLLPRRGP
jgi:prepilin-type N-terminal cleavage/methylation domain-containing protein